MRNAGVTLQELDAIRKALDPYGVPVSDKEEQRARIAISVALGMSGTDRGLITWKLYSAIIERVFSPRIKGVDYDSSVQNV